MNPLKQISKYGQAIWLDDIHRDLINSGGLKKLIDEDGLCGMTSNPAIFKKAISGSDDYSGIIRSLKEKGCSAEEILEKIMVEDVRMAADIFEELYAQSELVHGYVSLEVNPHLARKTEATIEEARRLWEAVNRPNVFIKVPGTREGLPAIRQLISEGINVNVTLLFCLQRYREVADAYLGGLEARAQQRENLTPVCSVASFFLSRIDALVDPQLEAIQEEDGERAETAKLLHGEVAISSAKLAYQIWLEVLDSERWRDMLKAGAQPQKLLWASTSTKNPDYSDVKYVEALIGQETINTLPMKTLKAYRDHGQPLPQIQKNLELAEQMPERLSSLGISLKDLTQELEDEGIENFIKPYDELLETLKEEMAAV